MKNEQMKNKKYKIKEITCFLVEILLKERIKLGNYNGERT